MTYTDFDCGIKEVHRHTGEIVEGYFIEYWCPSAHAWMVDKNVFDIKCTCTDPHMKARIQHVHTEIIEILPPEDYDVVAWLKKEIKERFWCRLMEGEEAYRRKYGNDDTLDRVDEFLVRDSDQNPSPGSLEREPERGGSDHPEG